MIPAIAYLRTVYPLKLTMFFPTSFLDNFLVNNEVDLTDFTMMDTVMDQLYIMQRVFVSIKLLVKLSNVQFW